MDKSLTSRLVSITRTVVLIILLLIPFHEFFTTWLASNFGHIYWFRIWPEIILLLISSIVIYLALANKKLKNWLLRDRLTQLILLFSVIATILGIVGYYQKRVNLSALGAGAIIDLRLFLIFLFSLVITQYSSFFKKYWKQILIYPALAVIAFGLAQLFLPIDFLRHFGYGPNTIPAFETVNQQLGLHRIQSTLRGANPFGTYLILIIPIFIFFSTKHRIARTVSSLISLAALFFSYSRSAYIGLVITLGIIFYYLKFENNVFYIKYRRTIYYLVFGVTVLAIASLLAFRSNSTFDNIFFHTNKHSLATNSSNSVRLSDLKTNAQNMIDHPLGQGLGVAGPASVHNNRPAMIAENFYIQIGQETGILGLIIFLSINIIIGYRLFSNRRDRLSLFLLASLVGISAVNMVSHAWADDTLSLIWWAFAGVALSPKLAKMEQ